MIGDGNNEKISVIQSLAYELKVAEVCVTDLVTLGPRDRMSDMRVTLQNRKISGIPVVDGAKLVGIISIEDLIRCLTQGRIEDYISEWMVRDVQVIYGDETVIQAITKFDRSGFGRFPVIERESEKLIGILTKGNIISGLLKKLEITFREEEIHRMRASHIFEDLIADEVSLNFTYQVTGQDFDRAGMASTDFKKTLGRLGIDPQITRRVSIATYEAEINIVVYTDGGTITAVVEKNKIEVTARDSGPGIPDIELAMQPGYSTAPEWVRKLGFGAGMGLCNIKKCSDSMNLTSEVGKGTLLTFVVNLNGKDRL